MSESDARLAHRLAEDAGRLLIELRRQSPEGGKALGDEGDAQANRLILDALAKERPHDAILSEEEADNLDRCSQSRVWVIDPLDGTREFREGRDDWAVHVALAIDGKPDAGAVALPARGLVLTTDGPPALAEEAAPLRFLVSRTRPSPEAVAICDRMGGELVAMGSCGAKVMALLLGEADVYYHTGGQHEWDNCAPAAVALAAGLHVSRVDGSPLVYNCATPFLPDLLICHRSRAAQLIAMTGEF